MILRPRDRDITVIYGITRVKCYGDDGRAEFDVLKQEIDHIPVFQNVAEIMEKIKGKAFLRLCIYLIPVFPGKKVNESAREIPAPSKRKTILRMTGSCRQPR